MRKRFKDWIALLEAGYDLEGSDEEWLSRLLTKAVPLMQRGMWPSIATYQFNSSQVNIEYLETNGPQNLVQWVHASTSEVPQVLDLMYRSSTAVASMSEYVYTQVPELKTRVTDLTNGLMLDLLGIKAHSGTGRGVILFTGFALPTCATSEELKRWPLIVSHLGAGLRLRRVAQKLTLQSRAVEAILSPSGGVEHIECAVNSSSNRSSLSEATRTIEHLRNSHCSRSDPDRSLPLWQGLVNGRWSLVDRFDTDGKRFIIAVKNDPTHDDPRGLTRRERQVAEYIGLGYSTKAIAYTLGISPAGITNSTARIIAKLGLSSRLELVAFFSPGGLRARLIDVTLAGEDCLVGSYPLVSTAPLDVLTDAEREVLFHLVAGSTYLDIAQRRTTSARTVANQVQSIYRKLKVKSRASLVAQLQVAPSLAGYAPGADTHPQ